MNEKRFRERLEQITKSRNGRSADMWLPDIEALRCEYHHTIQRADVHPDGGFNCNCFAYALGLTSSRWYEFIRRRRFGEHLDLEVFANAQFVLWLLNDGRLKKNRRLNQSESIIFYFHGSTPEHAGRFRNDRVISKWGTGYWFEHGVFEVPANYGDSIECYTAPTTRGAEDAFLEFAAAKGVPVNDLVPHWNL